MSAAPDFDPEYGSPAEWAREYRRLGLQIVPGYMPSEVAKGKPWKRPRFAEWTEFQEALVPDAVFDRWYGPQGEYIARLNMGIIAGRASDNLFVVDLDVHKGPTALAWWVSLLAVHNNGMEIETAEQRTGGGGIQKLFRAPTGWHCPTNRTPLGVDIRGQGGFAVFAPSLHESGRSYEWLPGRAPWDDCGIALAPQWLLDAVIALVAAHGGDTSSPHPKTRTPSPGGDYDAFGHQHDGREEKMRDLIWGAVVDWYRECPIKPGEREQHAKASEKYLIYESLVVSRLSDPTKTKTQLLEQEGRGPTEFWSKWQTAMKHWDDKVRAEARKPSPRPDERARDYSDEFAKASENAEAKAKANPSNLLEYLNIDQVENLPAPQWLVDKLVVEQALGFIYGPPGCLKTFIALDIALSLTTKQTKWWGRDIQRSGAVVYISSEGQADLKYRIMAWRQHRNANTKGSPFFLIRQNVNFMRGEDIGILLATLEAIRAEAGVAIAAVFVDTVSRVLPGAEENLQKDMTLFIAACDNVRQRFGCTVFGVHHTSRNGNMRGSTVMPGAGDFIIEVRREPGAMFGSIFAFKIKAAEDGWEQNFKVAKITFADIAGTTSLVVDAVDEQPKREAGNGWPDINVCRQILAAIDEQWHVGKPWCFARNSSRAAMPNIMKRWRLEQKIVADILATWTANGVIVEEVRDKENHVKGYRKLVEI